VIERPAHRRRYGRTFAAAPEAPWLRFRRCDRVSAKVRGRGPLGAR
jgi:hypothetical protein